MPTVDVASAPADAPASTPPGPMHCTCIGLCCGCAMATLPASAVGVPVVAVSAIFRTAPLPAVASVPAAPRFVLPPAIGPPALHTA